jgi:hypothetical protein
MTTSITVLGRGPNYCRFRQARDIQDACNPSGVAHELVRVIQDAMRDPACKGTDWVCSDAAVVATVDKLQSLMRLDAFQAHRICAERAEGRPAGRPSDNQEAAP